jgi:aminopeptidase
MKPDNRITKLAQVLVKYSLGVKEREKVSIVGSTASEPLLREIYQELLLSGVHPSLPIR